VPLYRAAPAAVQSRAATAALGFYRELSELPPNFLVDSLPCPLLAFWGRGRRRDRFRRWRAAARLRAGPPQDHINEALPSVPAWFDELEGRGLRPH
jgi:hypothetical protein